MQRIIISVGLLILFSIGVHAQKGVDFNTLNSETYRLYLSQKWDSVIVVGKQALQQEIDFYYLRIRMGVAYYSKKNYRTAARHFSAALNQNQNDPLALEYLYFSRLFSGQTERAGLIRKQFKGELAHKLPPLSGRFFDQLGVEFLYNIGVDDDIFSDPAELYPLDIPGSQSTTRYFFNASLSLINRITPGIRLSHAFTFLSKSNHYFTSDGLEAIYLPEQQVLQVQYYLAPEFTTRSGTRFMPMIHILGIKYQVPFETGSGFQGGSSSIALAYSKQIDMVSGLGFSQAMGKVDLHMGAYYSTLNQKKQFQSRLGMAWYPLGNLKLYTGGFLNSQYESTEGMEGIIRFIPEVMLGFSIAEKVWIDMHGTMGEMTNYLENNGLIVYNSYAEVIEKKINISLSVPVTESGSLLYLGGRWTSNRSNYLASDPDLNDESNSIYYNAISIYGGLLWKF